MPKLYDVIRHLLTTSSDLRYNDKALMWEVWKQHGLKGNLTREQFMTLEDTETIRRTRQKVQEDHKELGRNGVTKKETTGGKFVYHTKTPIFDSVNNSVRFEI